MGKWPVEQTFNIWPNIALPMTKTLADLRWLALVGKFEYSDHTLTYVGHEYDPPSTPTPQGGVEPVSPEPVKFVYYGTLVFNQNFTEGPVKCQVEFDAVDHRTN